MYQIANADSPATESPRFGRRADGGVVPLNALARRQVQHFALLVGFLRPERLSAICCCHLQRLNRRIRAGVLNLPRIYYSCEDVARDLPAVVDALSLWHLHEALAREHLKQLESRELVEKSERDEFRAP